VGGWGDTKGRLEPTNLNLNLGLNLPREKTEGDSRNYETDPGLDRYFLGNQGALFEPLLISRWKFR
jgi:hypothetical protein